MPSVFINYRVEERTGYAALLDRELSARFGAGAVFRAPRSIRPGEDFARRIADGLRECAVLLAVMGPDWVAVGRRERRVVGGEADWVRREIADAFALGLRVVPVLVDGAVLPVEDDLPPELAPLARCQFLRLDDTSVEHDVARIVRELSGLVPEAAGVAEPVTEAYALGGTPRIGVVGGDILRVRFAEAWVNSENTDLEMARTTEFSMSGIIRYWGAERDRAGRVVRDVVADELAAVVGDARPAAPGSTYVTGAGALTASHGVRHVIHVATVRGEPGSGFRPVHDLGRCVSAVLAEAARLGVASVLVPVLGTGVGRAAVAPTCRVLVGAALEHLAASAGPPMVWFLGYTAEELAALRAELGASPRLARVEHPVL